MKRSAAFRNTVTSVGVLALLIPLSALPAQATSAQDPPAPEVSFSYLSSESFADVYESIIESNDPAVAASFFEYRASSGESDADLPGLEDVAPEAQQEVLIAAADAARSGEPLPISELPADISAPSTVPEMGTMSYGSASILGAAIADRRAWQYTDRYNISVCSFTCTVTSWLEFRITTNPGNTGTRTDVNFAEFGTEITGASLRSYVYRSGTANGSRLVSWNTPGYGSQTNTHSSMNGKTFQGYNVLSIGSTKGTATLEYKTGNASCGDPTGAGFRCVF